MTSSSLGPSKRLDVIVSQVTSSNISGHIQKKGHIRSLLDGNERYLNNAPKTKNQSVHRMKLAKEGQRPSIAVLACADSRVPVEQLFDADAGELFVCRVAGNVVNSDVLASFEYAVSNLATKLIVVLGHTHCGAVAAAMSGKVLPGHLPNLVSKIWPSIQNATNPVEANVNVVTKVLSRSFPECDIVGAVFDIESGVVQFL